MSKAGSNGIRTFHFKSSSYGAQVFIDVLIYVFHDFEDIYGTPFSPEVQHNFQTSFTVQCEDELELYPCTEVTKE